jgi:putative colanic acid biosysnthesis UDP-glucose lipid carrier transferase
VRPAVQYNTHRFQPDVFWQLSSSNLQVSLKRLVDVVFSSFVLILLAPLLVLIGIGVKLSSPGPVLFKQRRHGIHNREIIVYKFRSMRVMEDGTAIPQATRNDARVTPFGAFLRSTSLDELPQFINVLQGRMSIVGPRPHAIAHNEAYRKLIDGYMLRHRVKPGITGWAQINGHRGETDTLEKMKRRLKCDLNYINHWSLALDLQIILRTVLVFFKTQDVY